MTQQPVLLTVREVATKLCPYFKVGPAAVRNWINLGRLGDNPAVVRTPGGGIRVRLEAVEAVIQGEDPTEAVLRADAAMKMEMAA